MKGSPPKLFKMEVQNGGQFRVGTWAFDFLAVDKGNNDLVVIELKKGRISDKVVGQILRYIAWINENLAK